MSHPGDIQRKRLAIWLGGAALVSALIGGLSLMPASSAPKPKDAGALALPAFAQGQADASLIMVTTSEGAYHIVRDGGVWVLTEKGRHPVRPELVEQLVASFATLRLAEPKTADARKFDQLGLGDPAEGGAGALVEIGNGRGEAAKLIVGRKDGRTYVRRPGEAQAWLAANGDPPPLHRPAYWLDLAVVKVAPADIARVDLRMPNSPPYGLTPLDADGARFGLAPPNDARRLIAGFAPNPPALATTRWSPDDVAPASVIGAAQPVAEHVTSLKNGSAVRLRAFVTPGGRFVTVEATGPQAEAINARTRPWAYVLSEPDWNALTTPLSAIAD